MQRHLRQHWPSIAIFIGFFALYAITLVRGVSTADNAEFQWVGATLGLAHPPGFPLYTLLSYAMTWLPIPATPATKINLLSAITSSLTLVVVYLMTHKLTNSKLAALASTLALGTATTFWAQATVANVRSLTALFAAAAFWMLITIYDLRFTKTPSPRGEGAVRPPHSQFTIHNLPFTILFSILLGLGFTHHLSLAFIFLIMVLWLLWQDWRTWKYLPYGLLGLLPWLYLPIVVPNLRNPNEFLTYALGLGFGGDFFAFSTPSELWLRAGVMLNVLTFQMHWVLLVAALIGWLVLLWHNRPVAILLGATFGIHTFITATYRAPQTVEYMLPAYVPLAICIGGIGLLGRKGAKAQRREASAVAGIAVALVCLALLQGWQKFDSFLFIATSTDTRAYTDDIFDGAPDGATVLSNWHWYTALRYRQEVEAARPDLDVRYVVPRGESYAANWAEEVAEGLAKNRPIIATNIYDAEYAQLPPSMPIGEALLWPDEPTSDLPADFQAADFILGDLIQIIGYKLDPPNRICFGNRAEVTLAWRPLTDLPPLNLFVHQLLDDGQIAAQSDQPARAQSAGISLTQFTLMAGPPAASGDLLIGAYLADGTPLPDPAGNNRSKIGALNVVPTGCQFDDIQIDQATHGHGIRLVAAPSVRQPSAGETLHLNPQFVSGKPLMRDLAVSITMVGLAEDGQTWTWATQSDGIPATGAIPTLKWIQGSAITDRHSLTVPADATPGQTVKAWLTLYDAFTNRPIPVLDPIIRAQGVGIPLFETTLNE